LPHLTIQQAFEAARSHQAAGQHREAEVMLRQILRHQPTHLDSMLMLGFMLAQQQRFDEAENWIDRAKAIAPKTAAVFSNLAVMRAMQQRWPDALEAVDAAIAIQPNSVELLNTRANILQASGRMEEAVAVYRKLVELRPGFAAGWNNLGAALSMSGRTSDAIASFERAAEIDPRDAGTNFNLGRAFGELGENDRALAALKKALDLKPNYADAMNQRGVIFQSTGRVDEALTAFQQAIAMRPDYAEAHNNLGVAHQVKRDYQSAIEAHRRAIQIRPNYPDACGNLAQALSQVGELDESLKAYYTARSLTADRRTASGMMLFIHTHPEFDAAAILREHQIWEATYPRPLYKDIKPHSNNRAANRRLRVAYLSADLNEHPAGRFMLPVMQHHDHREFEIICYYDNRDSDSMTERLRQHTDEWHNTGRLIDAQLAEKIRADKIDIVVDLLMHARGNRMLTLARKPAPVQISYLAYCSTTGLPTVDYRISDPYLDPPGVDESVYSEKTARVSASYWCYSAPDAAPEVTPPPSESNHYVTFGCMNNFWKVSKVAIRMWGELLQRIPNSRLLVHSHEGGHRQKFINRLGVDQARVEFSGFQPAAEYFHTFSRIDISLDPFPYGGGTTTCDSLWMGVPVVSRMGATAVSRGGSSILSNVGLAELLSATHDDYVQVAMALAADAARLRELRFGLRDRMRRSPLMDGPRLARDLEGIYRNAWRTWCASDPQ
jgi:protein O-GlcNAc transferase